MKRKSKILECALEAQRHIDNLERENKKLKRIIKSLRDLYEIHVGRWPYDENFEIKECRL